MTFTWQNGKGKTQSGDFDDDSFSNDFEALA